MAGRMGGRRATVQNLELLRIDQERRLLMIAGPIPGRRGGHVVGGEREEEAGRPERECGVKVPVLGPDGNPSGEIELDDRVFDIEVSDGAIHAALRNELANQRVGTAATKRRGQVRGGGRKPYRQKGTGRARAGSRRSPLWVGGGITFGPQPRDFRYRIPRKVKRLAIRSVLTSKCRGNQLMVVDGVQSLRAAPVSSRRRSMPCRRD